MSSHVTNSNRARATHDTLAPRVSVRSRNLCGLVLPVYLALGAAAHALAVFSDLERALRRAANDDVRQATPVSSRDLGPADFSRYSSPCGARYTVIFYILTRLPVKFYRDPSQRRVRLRRMDGFLVIPPRRRPRWGSAPPLQR